MWKVIGVLFLAATPQISLAEGGTVENGGNVIFCREAASFDVQLPPIRPEPGKFYVLDYVHALGTGYSPDSFVAIANWEQSRQRLHRLLKGVSLKLANSFEDFAESTNQIEGNWGRMQSWPEEREWVLTRGGHIRREHANLWRVPKNCIFNGKFLEYHRAVTRTSHRQKVIYRYSRKLLESINDNSPLQFSILMAHEWLWDHTRDLKVNRRVSVFLHSKEIDRMTDKEIWARLKRYGLVLR